MITWVLFKTSVKKAALWLKKHWQVPFLMLWTAGVYVLTRRNTDAMLEVVEAKRDSYKEQVQILRKSHNDEIIKRNDLTKKYEDTLAGLEKQFEVERDALTEAQRNVIKEVVIKSKGNPDQIKKKIQEEFGFNYVE